eukprot:TRINITY_DN16441_c0_g1_i2.p1 TRINITY_DN16441_c0_g1~~TRINITY_DN16441_c0_g1_i2.p1  ORF type:complete len:684 (+),score=109.47 TRINITY_DN16441_c0_g1_i2:127-2178(+)
MSFFRGAVVMAAAGAAMGNACPIQGAIGYATKGQACSSIRRCLNDGIIMDDFQIETVHKRYGNEYGLYCSDTGVCLEKKPDGYTCRLSKECQSALCIDNVCIEEGSLAPHQRCPSNGEFWQSACGGMCWPDSLNLLSVPETNWVTICSPLSEENEGCSVIYERVDSDVPPATTATVSLTLSSTNLPVPPSTNNVVTRVKYDSCNPDGSDKPRYHSPSLLRCVPTSTFLYPSNPTTVHDVTARGFCQVIATVDEGVDCSPFLPSMYRYDCEAADFCNPHTKVCTAAITEGERCSEYDTCKFGSACRYLSVEADGSGNLIRYGVCTDLHSLDDGHEASSVAFCKFHDGTMNTLQQLSPQTNQYYGTCKSVALATCTVDDDCVVPNSAIPFPYYCNTVTRVCTPIIPDSCEKEWKDYAEWSMGRSHSTSSLKGRKKKDKEITKYLIRCIFEETESCLSSLGFLQIPSIPTSVSSLVAMKNPKMLSIPQYLLCDSSEQGADFCSDDGISTGMFIVILCCAGCALCMCLMILCGEYRCCAKMGMAACAKSCCGVGCWAPRDPNEKEKKNKKERSSSSSSSKSNQEMHENPIAVFTSGKSLGDEKVVEPQRHTYTPVGTPEHKPAAVGIYPNGSPVTVWYEGHHDGFHGWFNANVTGYDPSSNTYEVKYDTNEVSDGVSPASVRLRFES